MDMFSYMRRLPDYREKESEGHKQMNVTFYPEGGHFVAGLHNRIAFAVTNEKGQHFETHGWLEEDGEKVCDVVTLREGRGIFECEPGAKRLILHLYNENGNERSFRLPKAEEEGCVLFSDASEDDFFTIGISRSQMFVNQKLGLVAICHGKPTLFRDINVGEKESSWIISKDSLASGVCQLALIDTGGNILAERMVFVYPKGVKGYIECEVENQQLSPYGKITLNAHSHPNTTFSLAVRDYDSQVNGWSCNARSWMLLASDLKGYIENADYYLESDDAEHRQASDLLMMVQGWRRYNVSKMVESHDFKLQQLLEQRILLEGRLYNGQKKEKQENKEKYVYPNIYVMASSLNTTEDAVGGLVKTLDDGRFAIFFSPFHGPREVVMRPDLDGDISQYEFSLNRWFSPLTRHIYESTLKSRIVRPH